MRFKLLLVHLILPSIIVLFDQLSKYVILESGYLPFVELDSTYIKNYGFLFSALSYLPETHKLLGLITVLCIVLSFYIFFVYAFQPSLWLFRWGMSLMMAGIVGNVLDKLVHGYVIDWLQISWWKNSPFFNISDVSLVFGYIFAISSILTLSSEVNEEKFQWTSLIFWKNEIREGIAPYVLIFVVTFAVTFLFSYAYLFKTIKALPLANNQSTNLFLAYGNFMLEIFLALSIYVLLFASHSIQKKKSS